MSVELKNANKNNFAVYNNGYHLGNIVLYENKYHKSNQYLKFEFKHFDCTIAKEIILQLKKEINRSLQVMVSSNNYSYIDFLKFGGFECKRKNYTIIANKKDYVGGSFAKDLFFCKKGDKIYEQICQIMFEYYCENHKNINAWTAGFEMFCEILPKNVVYQIIDEKIQNFAFVEKNEIAYIAGLDRIECEDFAKNLINYLFCNYKKLKFEIDNCDENFLFLKELFVNQNAVSFDTYVYDQ